MHQRQTLREMIKQMETKEATYTLYIDTTTVQQNHIQTLTLYLYTYIHNVHTHTCTLRKNIYTHIHVP